MWVRRSVCFAVLLTVTALGVGTTGARAHCDTMDGPVVAAARQALAARNLQPVLKWIRPSDEKEVRSVFTKTLAVRAKGPDARDLADRFFFETLVRVHRAGEGEPYVGLLPSGTLLEPGIAQADRALESASVDALSRQISTEVASAVRTRFHRVLLLKKDSNKSVAAGRRYVAAYVDYIHFVERLSTLASGKSSEHGETASHREAVAR